MEKNSKIWTRLRKINKKFVKNVGGGGKLHNKVAQKLLFLVVGAALMFVFSPHKTAFAEKKEDASGVNIGNLRYTLYSEAQENGSTAYTATVTGFSSAAGTDKTTMAPPATVSWQNNTYTVDAVACSEINVDTLSLDHGIRFESPSGIMLVRHIFIGPRGAFISYPYGWEEVESVTLCGPVDTYHYYGWTNVFRGLRGATVNICSSSLPARLFTSCDIADLILKVPCPPGVFDGCSIRRVFLEQGVQLSDSPLVNCLCRACFASDVAALANLTAQLSTDVYVPCSCTPSDTDLAALLSCGVVLHRVHDASTHSQITDCVLDGLGRCSMCGSFLPLSRPVPQVNLTVAASPATFASNSLLTCAMDIDDTEVARADSVELPGTVLPTPALTFSNEQAPTFDRGGTADVKVTVNGSSTTLENQTVCDALSTPTYTLNDFTPPTVSKDATLKITTHVNASDSATSEAQTVQNSKYPRKVTLIRTTRDLVYASGVLNQFTGVNKNKPKPTDVEELTCSNFSEGTFNLKLTHKNTKDINNYKITVNGTEVESSDSSVDGRTVTETFAIPLDSPDTRICIDCPLDASCDGSFNPMNDYVYVANR